MVALEISNLKVAGSSPVSRSMNTNWLYYGIFFPDNVKQELLKRAQAQINKKFGAPIPPNYKIYCDHVTIVYNDGTPNKQEIAATIDEMIGQPVLVNINSIGLGEGVIAFGVSNVETQNKQSHVTVATAPGVKPVASNGIKNWISIKEFSVNGVADVRLKKK